MRFSNPPTLPKPAGYTASKCGERTIVVWGQVPLDSAGNLIEIEAVAFVPE